MKKRGAMRAVAACASSVVVGFALALVPVSPASAASDYGNGAEYMSFCGPGEVCFRSEYNSDHFGRQFINSANHSAVSGVHGTYTWFDMAHPSWTNGPLMDTANNYRNYGNHCYVEIYNVDEYGNWFPITFQAPQSTTYLPTWSKNNGHSFCGDGSPKYK